MESRVTVFATTLVAALAGCNAHRAPSAAQADTMALVEVRDPADARDGGQTTEATLPSDFELGLSDAWACGDLLLHVANPERSVMLTVYWPRLLDQASPADAERGWVGELGGPAGPDVAIVVHTGHRLDAGTCARDGDEAAVIDETWTAVAEIGRLGLDSADGRSRLSAWLWDVELRRQGDGARVVVEQLEQLDVELTS